jgi:hypothetical protein
LQILSNNGKPLTTEEKWLILNVYQRCRKEHEQRELSLSDVSELRAYYAGVSRKVVVDSKPIFGKRGRFLPQQKQEIKRIIKPLFLLKHQVVFVS